MIINIVGASGSGKTTIARSLGKDGYNIIQSYTTRPRRYDGEWGHEFIENYYPVYVNDSFVGLENPKDEKYIDIDDMVAYFIGHDYCYFTTREQFLDNKVNIYIVDELGAKQVHDNIQDMKVLTIFLQCDEDVRLERLRSRFKQQYGDYCLCNMLGNYEKEVNQRIEDDRKIRNLVKCDYVINGNQDVDDIVKNLIKIINRELKQCKSLHPMSGKEWPRLSRDKLVRK